MISKLLFLSLLLVPAARAFDKDFTTVNDRVPHEFSVLFDSLKASIDSPAEKIKMVGLCKDLDENLGYLPKDQIFLLMKSEVMKNVLQHPFKKLRQVDVNAALLKRIDDAYARKERLLTPFSLWVWRSVAAELRHRQGLGLVTEKAFDVRNFTGTKLPEAQRFARYLTYLKPWLERMENATATEFNQLTKHASWIILRSINNRSLLFKRFASTITTDVKTTTFNIPRKLLDLHPEDIKRMQKDQTSFSLKDESEKERSKAREQVDKATVEDMSPVSDELAKELEKKAQ